MISSCVIEAAPWRFEVPMQSEPVSPPPMTMTCLPLAVSVPRGAARVSSSPALRLFCWVRKSIAKWMPRSSRPGTSRSRGCSAPPASAIASKFSSSDFTDTVDADLDARAEFDAFGFHLPHAAVDEVLLHLEVGDAVAQQAADAVALLEQRRRYGRRARAAARRPCRPGPSRPRPRACRSSSARAAARSSLLPSRGRRSRIRSS